MTAFETADEARDADTEARGMRVTDGTFTLDEMLRFAASTARTATVHVEGARAGRVAFRDGRIVGADVAGHAACSQPAGLDRVVDVLLELEVEAAGTGCFELVPGVDAATVGGAALAVDDVLATKAARVREWKEIVAGLPGAGAVLRRASDLTRPVTIDADGWRVLGALDGGASVARLTRTTGIGTFATCRAVRRLLDAGAVTVDEETDPGAVTVDEETDTGVVEQPVDTRVVEEPSSKGTS